ADDALITGLVRAVRLACETECQRTLLLTTRELVVDRFPRALRLDWPRVIAVESVKYLDVDGVQQTLHPDDYLLDNEGMVRPGWLVPAYGLTWPDTRAQVNAVRVRYTAGYGSTAADVPEDLKLWMRLHLSHYYVNRSATVAG